MCSWELLASRRWLNSSTSISASLIEDSQLVNANIRDLPFRIEEHIPNALKYSALYWSNHHCFTPDIIACALISHHSVTPVHLYVEVRLL